MLMAVCVCQGQLTQARPSARKGGPAPLLLEKNEANGAFGAPPGGFMLKISPKNNRSRDLVMGINNDVSGKVNARGCAGILGKFDLNACRV
jgi:hypothetical protein